MPDIGFWLAHLQEMTISCTQGIRSIHEFRHILVTDVQHPLQHARHLFLGSLSLSRNGHLDFQRGILMNRHIMMDSCSNGYSLSPPQFQHRLDVLSKDRSLDGHLIREILINDTGNTLEDFTQSEIRITLLAHIDDTHDYQLSLITCHPDDPIAHHIGSRVNTKNDFFYFIHRSIYGL